MYFQIEEVNNDKDDVIAYVHLRHDKWTIDNYSQLHLRDSYQVMSLPAPTKKVLWAFNFENIGPG